MTRHAGRECQPIHGFQIRPWRSNTVFGRSWYTRLDGRTTYSHRVGSRRTGPRLCRPHLERLETRDLPSGAAAVTDQLREAYGRLPLSFEANQGQTDAQVHFLARGSGYALFLTPTETVFGLRKRVASGTGTA